MSGQMFKKRPPKQKPPATPAVAGPAIPDIQEQVEKIDEALKPKAKPKLDFGDDDGGRCGC